MRFLHRLCAVLSGGGGRDFFLSFLPSSRPPSAAISPLSLSLSPLPFFSFFLSLFPLSSGVVVQPPLVHPSLPSRPPLASFHPLQSCRSRFYGGAQLRFFPSLIYRPSFLYSSDTPHQGFPHHPSYLSMSSLPYSSHHAPPLGQHTPTRASHVSPRSPRAAARSSSANLLSPCPLLQLLLSGLFYYSFFIKKKKNSLYCLFFVFLFSVCLVFCGLLSLCHDVV